MIMDAIRSLMFFLDSVVFWTVRLLFELFMLISNAEIFSSDIIKGFYGRIYALVGIFMLFKISFSVITMIANPDTLNDKNQGLGKITTKVMITILLLLIMPNIFNLMYDLQREIVKSNILGTVILGIEEGEKIDTVSIGKQLSYTSFSGFFYCREDLRTINSDGSAECNITNSTVESAWNNAKNNYDISILGDVLNTKQDDKYIFEYKSPMSLVCGIFIAYILISFCIDIAVRSVKLGFLQIMAPIPIILNVDPKSSKDGAFNNWVKTLVVTYLDLFMRLIIIFFIVFVLGAIDNITFKDSNASWTLQQFAKIFIIIGALMFAKQAPGLIKDLFGIKGDSNAFGDLNPLKKMAGMPGGAKLLGGATALGALGAAGLGAAAGKLIGNNKVGNYLSTNAGARLNTAFNRLNSKNWNDKGAYTGPKTKDLTAQAMTGDPNARGGLLGGFMYRAESAAQRNLAYNTVNPEKTPELKRAIGNQITAGNKVQNQDIYMQQFRKRAENGDAAAIHELSILDGFNAKASYEGLAKEMNWDSETYFDINTTTATGRNYLENIYFTDANGNITGSRATTEAEKKAILEYAQKVSGDVVEKEQRKMPGKK